MCSLIKMCAWWSLTCRHLPRCWCFSCRSRRSSLCQPRGTEWSPPSCPRPCNWYRESVKSAEHSMWYFFMKKTHLWVSELLPSHYPTIIVRSTRVYPSLIVLHLLVIRFSSKVMNDSVQLSSRHIVMKFHLGIEKHSFNVHVLFYILLQ